MLVDTVTTCLLVCTLCYGVDYVITRLGSLKYHDLPKAGIKSNFATQLIHNLQFAVNPIKLISDGYAKFERQAFRLIRNDGNIVVLPHSLLEELSTLPVTVADPHAAIERDFLGPYSGLDRMVETGLHRSAIRWLLTPLRLNALTGTLENELNHVFEENFPECDEWTEVSPFQMFEKVSARLSGRVLVGVDLCRDPFWMDFAANYPKTVMMTVIILRFFPYWMHPVLCYLIPPYWSCQRYISRAKRVIGSRLEQLMQEKKKSSTKLATADDDNDDDVSSVLEWLATTEKGSDQTPQERSHIIVMLTLASIHTVVLRMVMALYDLIDNPELFDELRAEINEARTSPPFTISTSLSSSPESQGPVNYNALPKLDSVLRESQRMTPASTLGLKRIFKKSHTFSTGLHIPRGSYVCLPVYSIENDPATLTDPAKFDGLRSYRTSISTSTSDANDENREKTFSSIDRTFLGFGHGKFACPGRFYASLAIKILFVRLLEGYKFEFLGGGSRAGNGNGGGESGGDDVRGRRPRNIQLHESICTWPWTRVKVRRRKPRQDLPGPVKVMTDPRLEAGGL